MNKYKEALEDMVWQFANRGTKNKKLTLWTVGLSALEHAFDVLGWKDPHFVEDKGLSCEHPGCYQWSTCGIPTKEGYKRLCSEHYKIEVK